jgi:GT2 family glycosyltransferase
MEYQGIRQTGYVSGCAMYIKRSTIEQIGEFDTQFHPCYYEDSDFCYTALQSGLITVVTAHSIVVHHEGATSGNDLNKGMKQYQTINKQKFISKHFL